jgi:hypothetical protein
MVTVAHEAPDVLRPYLAGVAIITLLSGCTPAPRPEPLTLELKPPPAPSVEPAATAATATAVAAAQPPPKPALRLFVASSTLESRNYLSARVFATFGEQTGSFFDSAYLHDGQPVHDPTLMRPPPGSEMARWWPPDEVLGDPPDDLWALSTRISTTRFFHRTDKGWKRVLTTNWWKGDDDPCGPAQEDGLVRWQGRLLTPWARATIDRPRRHLDEARFLVLSGPATGAPSLPADLLTTSLAALPGDRLVALALGPSDEPTLLRWDERGGSPLREPLAPPIECGSEPQGLRVRGPNDVWVGFSRAHCSGRGRPEQGRAGCLGHHDGVSWKWTILVTDASDLSFDLDREGTAWTAIRLYDRQRDFAEENPFFRVSPSGIVDRLEVDTGGPFNVGIAQTLVDETGELWFFAYRMPVPIAPGELTHVPGPEGFTLFATHPVSNEIDLVDGP